MISFTGSTAAESHIGEVAGKHAKETILVLDDTEIERLQEEVDGNVMTPTILKGTNDMTTAQNEMFGPVVTIIPTKNDEQALKLANKTDADLSGALHTQDRDRPI